MTFGHSGLISNPQFERYIGIDYSGAETPTSGLHMDAVQVDDGVDGVQRAGLAWPPQSRTIVQAKARL